MWNSPAVIAAEHFPLSIPPLFPAGGNARVTLFQVGLDKRPDEIERLKKVLPDDEIRRARQFQFEPDRRRYIVARGTLRKIFSQVLDCDPGKIRFEHAPTGKPSIPGSPLHFNVSHSHEMAMIALSSRQVGIDIEYVVSRNSHAGIIRRYFSSEEQAFLSSAPSTERQRRFFQVWTLKEAYLKATGEGMAGLDQIRTTWDEDGGNPRFCREDQPEEAGRWTIFPFESEGEYLGACLVENS